MSGVAKIFNTRHVGGEKIRRAGAPLFTVRGARTANANSVNPGVSHGRRTGAQVSYPVQQPAFHVSFQNTRQACQAKRAQSPPWQCGAAVFLFGRSYSLDARFGCSRRIDLPPSTLSIRMVGILL